MVGKEKGMGCSGIAAAGTWVCFGLEVLTLVVGGI